MAICNRILIQGRVQNVGFRYFTFKTARMLNLHGFVKNELDGSVSIEVQGDEDDLQTFIREIKKGPAWARIDHIDISSLPLQNYSDFSVK